VSAHVFNADYWIALTAIGPVLALANTVSIVGIGRTYLERAEAEQKLELRYGDEARPINLSAWTGRYWRAYSNFGVQMLTTFVALLCLEYRRDLVPPAITTLAVLASFVLLGVQAAQAGRDNVAMWMAKR
jgi:hypothetical protein